jgi:hypothetical protein
MFDYTVIFGIPVSIAPQKKSKNCYEAVAVCIGPRDGHQLTQSKINSYLHLDSKPHSNRVIRTTATATTQEAAVKAAKVRVLRLLPSVREFYLTRLPDTMWQAQYAACLDQYIGCMLHQPPEYCLQREKTQIPYLFSGHFHAKKDSTVHFELDHVEPGCEIAIDVIMDPRSATTFPKTNVSCRSLFSHPAFWQRLPCIMMPPIRRVHSKLPFPNSQDIIL